MTLLPRALSLVMFALVANAGHATTPPSGEPCASFRGEILEVDGSPKIIITRKGTEKSVANVGIGTPLLTGDKIQVTSSGAVRIIASPLELDYTLTQSDQIFEVNEKNKCPDSADTPNWLAATWKTVQRVLSEPIVDKPKTALPKRSLFCGAYSKNGTILDVEEQQLLVAGQDQIALHWLGMPAIVRVTANADGHKEILYEAAPAGGELQAVSKLSRPLQEGDRLILELQTVLGTNRRMVDVVNKDQLPSPSKEHISTELTKEDWLTASNFTLYAIWLATNASEEWRLQGMNFLKEAANHNPVANRIWRALWAEQFCSDSN